MNQDNFFVQVICPFPECKQIHPPFPSLTVLPMTVCCAGHSAQFLTFSLTKCDLPAGINGKHTGTLGIVPTHISGLEFFFFFFNLGGKLDETLTS